MKKNLRVLGIDPGSNRIGYGIIDCVGDSLSVVGYGVIEIFPAPEADRLRELSKRVKALLKRYRPSLAGVEKLFFAKNRKTAIGVSQARGALVLVLAETAIPVLEYPPQTIKQAVTGYGLADKKAVAKMVAHILKLDAISGYDDATDALAVAITAATRSRFDLDLTGRTATL